MLTDRITVDINGGYLHDGCELDVHFFPRLAGERKVLAVPADGPVEGGLIAIAILVAVKKGRTDMQRMRQ